MKLNHDLVRYVLLSIEECKELTGPDEKKFLASLKKYGTFERDDVVYTVTKLHEADFITGKITWASNVPMFIIPGNLTYEGHKFLDNIRDDGVWKDTKKVLSKFSSVSLSLVSNVAASVITQLIKRELGI